MKNLKPFSKDLIKITNVEKAVESIAGKLKQYVIHDLRRKGGVIGISGGIDSSVTLALSAVALGSENLLGVMLPEHDSSPESLVLAKKLAEKFKVKTVIEDVTDALKGFGCYSRRDEAVKEIFPEYNPEIHKMKIGVKQSGLYTNLPPIFHVTIIDEKGNEKEKKLTTKAYAQIVAASNFKQRSRMSMLYYHAERLHYAVIGTPNKHEVDQGFFVKYGDGGADVMPVGHLYKSQVYQLAEYLGVPNEIIERTPTTDTYTAEQTQEEFFYQLPFHEMDILWYAFENGYPTGEVGKEMNKTAEEIQRIFNNFERKKHTTEYLRMSPIKDF